jgi:glycosyltransferase involved in cell wall biosynthesis
LPTRNRLEYLKYAVETVRRQDYDDWEIIIADNASDDDVESYVRSLNDERVVYSRSDHFIPVTENWNLALEQSSGDFVIMLGDDDGLMKGYFRRVRWLIEEYGSPELIYSSGYLYAYPGVLPGHQTGLLHHYRNATFLRSALEPFWLPTREATRLVRQSLDFKMKFTFNMQYFLIARSLIDKLGREGPVFQSPFPDYYASNVMLMKAQRILIEPRPLVAIGITPKSYGYYLFNNREPEGVDFLHGSDPVGGERPHGRPLLPGTNMNSSWLLAMEAIVKNYGRTNGLRVNYGRYRRLQIVHVLRGHLEGTVAEEIYGEVKKGMRPWERAVYGVMLLGVSLGLKLLRGRPRALFRSIVTRAHRGLRASVEWRPASTLKACGDMIEVFESVGEPLAAGGSRREPT